MRGTIWRWAAAVGLLVGLDQLSRWLAFASLEPGRSVPLLDGLAALAVKRNPGLIYNLGSNLPGVRLLAVGLSVGAAFLIGWVYRHRLRGRAREPWAALFTALALAGILGHLVDRAALGYVRDFLWLRGFGTVNLADLYITAAVGAAAAILWTGRGSDWSRRKA